ncbi:glycoside hydrolase family 95 protein [Wukongibacter baidiensis]|uniref:glycoside hydrolase family 95 protein n=1 Tax=Wukongibacter baidiensis TaxID=1723361 RepID=UPI003D7F3BBA
MTKNRIIHYNTHAKNWNEALPIGNGRMGGMVYSDPLYEHIKLNEDTLWSGMPYKRPYNNMEEPLNRVREQLFNKNYIEAQKILETEMMGPWNESFQPMGDIYFDMNHLGAIENYKRYLDLNNSILRSIYEVDGCKYEREIFASYKHDGFVMKFNCSKQKINMKIRLSSLQNWSFEEINKHTIALNGTAPAHVEQHGSKKKPTFIINEEEGIRFQFSLSVSSTDGKAYIKDQMLWVEDASEVICLITSATSFNGFDKDPVKDGKDYKLICKKIIDNMLELDYQTLFNEHLEDYQNLFKSVDVSFNGKEISDIPIDKRLKEFDGRVDTDMVELMFHYGRYLKIISSRPGTQPTHLQGLWNSGRRPYWASNYTININTQMNYWLAESTNLSECHEPLFKMIEELSDTGRALAEVYGCKGWAVHHNVDLWRNTNPRGETDPKPGKCRHSFWPMGGPWLCQHLWERYAYTLDEDFLRERAYPLMKGASEFVLDWLVEDEKGQLVTAPSTSPENMFLTPDEKMSCSVSVATTMDMGIIRDLFENLVKACDILKIDDDYKMTLLSVLKKLPAYKIGRHGQIQEWLEDFEEKTPGHKHQSHLFGLYPGKQISHFKTPELAEASKKSLLRREAYGGGYTGWSCAWLISMWARLLDGEKAYQWIQTLIGRSSYTNLLNLHPPMQIDGNFGLVAGLVEMMIQSHDNIIHLLPALPKALQNGSFKGIKARGGYEFELEWSNGCIKNGSINSKRQGVCSIRSSSPIVILNSQNEIVSETVTEQLYTFKTKENETYKIIGIE